MRGRSGAAVQIAERLELRRDFDRLLLRSPARTVADDDLTIDAAGGRGTVTLGGREYAVVWGREADGGVWRARLPLRLVSREFTTSSASLRPLFEN